MKLSGLSLFFPCYNEEGNIETVLRQALDEAPMTADRFEILVIDDDSADGTGRKVQDAIAGGHPVKLFRHPVNRGYGEALKTGFRNARFEWAFYADGDGQFDLADLARLADETPRNSWRRRAAAVIASKKSLFSIARVIGRALIEFALVFRDLRHF